MIQLKTVVISASAGLLQVLALYRLSSVIFKPSMSILWLTPV